MDCSRTFSLLVTNAEQSLAATQSRAETQPGANTNASVHGKQLSYECPR